MRFPDDDWRAQILRETPRTPRPPRVKVVRCSVCGRRVRQAGVDLCKRCRD